MVSDLVFGGRMFGTVVDRWPFPLYGYFGIKKDLKSFDAHLWSHLATVIPEVGQFLERAGVWDSARVSSAIVRRHNPTDLVAVCCVCVNSAIPFRVTNRRTGVEFDALQWSPSFVVMDVDAEPWVGDRWGITAPWPSALARAVEEWVESYINEKGEPTSEERSKKTGQQAGVPSPADRPGESGSAARDSEGEPQPRPGVGGS